MAECDASDSPAFSDPYRNFTENRKSPKITKSGCTSGKKTPGTLPGRNLCPDTRPSLRLSHGSQACPRPLHKSPDFPQRGGISALFFLQRKPCIYPVIYGRKLPWKSDKFCSNSYSASKCRHCLHAVF